MGDFPVELSFFFDKSMALSLAKNEILYHQHARADHLYLLVDGEVEFFGYNAGRPIKIGRCYTHGTPVGLGYFSLAKRYEVEARVSSGHAKFIAWTSEELSSLIEEDSSVSFQFLRFLSTKARNLIEESGELFLSLSGKHKTVQVGDEVIAPVESEVAFDQKASTDFLFRSPFFETFSEKDLTFLASHLRRFQYSAGQVIRHQGDKVEGIEILESGEVLFSRLHTSDLGSQKVWFRSVSTPGYLLGAAAVMNGVSDMTLVTSQDTVIYHVPIDAILDLERQDSEFGLHLHRRVIWLLMNQLRMVQTRLFSAELDEEIQLIGNLIDNNQSKLDMNSRLHEVPHLLNEKLTLRQGLDILHELENGGNPIERNLASLSLDNLTETEKEIRFYEALKKIFTSVVRADAEVPSREVRLRCIEATKDAFDIVRPSIYGLDDLPEKSGNIFIYNHLLNDPFYTLPNGFQITLDSHFLSTLVFDKYQRPPTRMVRIGRESEYAHEDYYGPQGFINVYTPESKLTEQSTDEKEKRREEIQTELADTLSGGGNLVVSPEGTSYTTSQSPGKFKSGVFRMAMNMDPEPLIVPVVLANFDQRVPVNYKCRILTPFKMSEELERSEHHDLQDFLTNYQKSYKKYIRDLIKEH